MHLTLNRSTQATVGYNSNFTVNNPYNIILIMYNNTQVKVEWIIK